MPELPEVEFGRRLAESVAAGRRIVDVTCAEDPIVFADQSPEACREALLGRRVIAVCRHGKQLWFDLDEAPHPLFHFGMTGAFQVPGERRLALASDKNPQTEPFPPRFAKIVLRFEDGGALSMSDARRLGRILLRENPRAEAPINRLGFDPWLAMPLFSEFAARLAGRRSTLKGLLLDQSFAAGVGNWIADEVLYQAALDPRRSTDSLNDAERRALWRTLKTVVHTAVKANAESDLFPKTWLFHARWGKTKGATTSKGEPIEHIQVAGRTTAYVPSRQR